uniref:Uncharacterized protein n=1 Tax=Chenopodium quinoa TaxID=63459 RepID=A0A803MP39_CHEQI
MSMEMKGVLNDGNGSVECRWNMGGDKKDEGDKNTKFFHQRASSRRRKNTISKIKDDAGELHFGDENIGEVANNYFRQLFTSSNPPLIDHALQNFQSRVTDDMNRVLRANYTQDEVKKALSQIHPIKAWGRMVGGEAWYEMESGEWEDLTVAEMMNFGYIPISVRRPADYLCWDLEQSGEFSVKSTYQAIYEDSWARLAREFWSCSPLDFVAESDTSSVVDWWESCFLELDDRIVSYALKLFTELEEEGAKTMSIGGAARTSWPSVWTPPTRNAVKIDVVAGHMGSLARDWGLSYGMSMEECELVMLLNQSTNGTLL